LVGLLAQALDPLGEHHRHGTRLVAVGGWLFTQAEPVGRLDVAGHHPGRPPALPRLEPKRLTVRLRRPAPPATVAAWRPGRPRATLLDLGLEGLAAVVPSGLAAA
jgi:hypothetical protein